MEKLGSFSLDIRIEEIGLGDPWFRIHRLSGDYGLELLFLNIHYFI